jgi:hypothetical protein
MERLPGQYDDVARQSCGDSLVARNPADFIERDLRPAAVLLVAQHRAADVRQM